MIMWTNFSWLLSLLLVRLHHYMSVGFFLISLLTSLFLVTFHYKRLFSKICSFIYTENDFNINILYLSLHTSFIKPQIFLNSRNVSCTLTVAGHSVVKLKKNCIDDFSELSTIKRLLKRTNSKIHFYKNKRVEALDVWNHVWWA